MTYDELIETCQDGIYETNNTFVAKALMAVVKLHEPLGNVCNWCTCHDCEHIVDYPCKTIRAIQKAME